jgi:hypothetical protein
MKKAYNEHPERFPKGISKLNAIDNAVYINKPKVAS